MKNPKSNKVTCWMCGGWGHIHPLDTGTFSHKGDWGMSDKQPVYVWAASRAQHQPGDVICPVCEGDLKAPPFQSEYEGDVLPLDSRIW